MKKVNAVFLVVFGFLEALAVLAVYNLRDAMLAIAVLGLLCYISFHLLDFVARKLLAFGAAGAAGLLGEVAFRAAKHYLGGAFPPDGVKTTTDDQLQRFMESGLTRDEARSALRNLGVPS